MSDPIIQGSADLVAQNLSDLMSEKGVSKAVVSQHAGVDEDDVAELISGRPVDLNYQKLQAISDYFGCDVRRLTVGPDFREIAASETRIADLISQLSADKRQRLEAYLEVLLHE